jgi:hypothetical protein
MFSLALDWNLALAVHANGETTKHFQAFLLRPWRGLAASAENTILWLS